MANHDQDAELAAKLQAELDAESDSSESEDDQPEPNQKQYQSVGQYQSQRPADMPVERQSSVDFNLQDDNESG